VKLVLSLPVQSHVNLTLAIRRSPAIYGSGTTFMLSQSRLEEE